MSWRTWLHTRSNCRAAACTGGDASSRVTHSVSVCPSPASVWPRLRRRSREPGTYFLTDFLARTFAHTVIRELGLDRHPELRDDYFGGYTRVVWLAQRRTPAAERA